MLTTEEIRARLLQLEKTHDIKILYACESGSRAWGFASKDSDYDIRFLYVRRPQDYISVYPVRDVIEEPVDAVWDINGWDLSKALKLMLKANSNLLEWLRSPIQYVPNTSFCGELLALANNHISLQKLFFSYQGMPRGNYRDYLQGESVWLKKYLYVIRPLLCSQWINRFGRLPPVRISELVSFAEDFFPYMAAPLKALLIQKQNGLEKEYGRRMPDLDRFIDESIQANYIGKEEEIPASEAEINAIFRRYVFS